MWPWLIVVGVWAIIAIVVGFADSLDWLQVVGVLVLGVVVFAGAIAGTIFFLDYYQAWGFVPQ